MRQAILIGLFLLGLVAAGSAQAATWLGTSNDFACSNSDLLQDATWNAALSNLSGTYYNDPLLVSESSLRNGTAAPGSSSVMASVAKPAPWGNGSKEKSSIWVYNLNTSVNTGGYNLSQVNLFFGDGTSVRNGMGVTVEYSKVGSDAFNVLLDMGYTQFTSTGYGKLSIGDYVDGVATGATIATGVDAVRFSWASDWTGADLNSPNPLTGKSSINNSGTPIWEIDVVGTATVGTPVPAPAGLALLGLGSMGLAFIRRRKAQKA